MYSTLLWATDGSDDAELALDEARRLLSPGGTLIVFHCDQRYVGGRAGGLPVVADEDDRRARIKQTVAALDAEGIDARLVLDVTHHAPARAIVEAADAESAEAIVCGCRGLGAIQGALLGSVSRELLHHAHVPVVVVPPHVAAHA